MMSFTKYCRLPAILLLTATSTANATTVSADEVQQAIRTATEYYTRHVASHGGYVYHYSLDLKTRWGEGLATPDQIWVQPPGTPTVGMALLAAHEATGDPELLQAAQAAGVALVYGQLQSGGWTNCIDFDPQGERVAAYRNDRGKGHNNSSLDDGQTQSALQFLLRLDAALGFGHKGIHAAAGIGLDALLRAQFANGAFPQVWDDELARPQEVTPAQYPGHDWRTEGKIKNYWDYYTLNDNVAGYVAQTLIEAHRTYGEPRYLEALCSLGDFLILAQMPAPQRGWAQQYNYDMQPMWARRFEPPAISGDESQEVMETLLAIYEATQDTTYLAPIPEGIRYLRNSLLADGQLARFYELRTNKPLYMVRDGKEYTLTYDDSQLPAHYGWKTTPRLHAIEAAYQSSRRGGTDGSAVTSSEVRQIIDSLDGRGRWVSIYNGERLVGQPRMVAGSRYLSSAVFSDNIRRLSAWLLAEGDLEITK